MHAGYKGYGKVWVVFTGFGEFMSILMYCSIDKILSWMLPSLLNLDPALSDLLLMSVPWDLWAAALTLSLISWAQALLPYGSRTVHLHCPQDWCSVDPQVDFYDTVCSVPAM